MRLRLVAKTIEHVGKTPVPSTYIDKLPIKEEYKEKIKKYWTVARDIALLLIAIGAYLK